MKLTILGSGAAAPGGGRACSGYLIEQAGVKLLLDCGSGVLSNLQKVLAPKEVTDIVISHMHFDHFLDLIPFGYWRNYGPGQTLGKPPRLHLPPRGKEVLASLVGTVGGEKDFFERAFQVNEYGPGNLLVRDSLSLTFVNVPHYVPSFAVALAQKRGGTLVFSADCGPSDALQRLASSADLLLAEATLEAPEPSANPGHMTATQAAQIAKAASVRRLVLTHFWPWNDRQKALASARAVFGEGVAIAEEGTVYAL